MVEDAVGCATDLIFCQYLFLCFPISIIFKILRHVVRAEGKAQTDTTLDFVHGGNVFHRMCAFTMQALLESAATRVT